jgi:hypothetical protein
MTRLLKLPPCPLCGASVIRNSTGIVCTRFPTDKGDCPYIVGYGKAHDEICKLVKKLKAARPKVIRRGWWHEGFPHVVTSSDHPLAGHQPVLIIADPAGKKEG